ncbi:MAG: hypothetical protein RLZZ127_273 [Planctomycetota bacterium]|jgi:membrane protease YdiL (CAAX protease family)
MIAVRAWIAAWLLALGKDLREVLRDRRALLMQIAVPALVGPLTMIAMGVIGAQVERGGDRPLRILVDDAALAPELATRSASAAVVADLPADAGAALARLRRDQVPAAVALRSGSAAVWLDGAHAQALAARQAAVGAAEAWREARRDALLAAAGVPASTAAVAVLVRDAAPRTETLRSHLGWPLLIVLALVAAAAAATVAADLVAGARERGTRDWGWALPLPRSAQVAAVAAAVSLAAALAATVNLGSLALSLALLGGRFGGGDLVAGALALVGPGLLAVIPLSLAVGGWATALAQGAASAREAQATLAPLVLGVTGLGLAGCLPGLRPGLPVDAVPVTGLVVALRDAMQGGAPWASLATAIAATLAAGIAGTAVAVQLADRAGDGPGPRAPGLLAGGLAFLATVAVLLGTAALLQDAPRWTAPLALLTLAAVPLGIAAAAGWEPGPALGLRMVPPRTLLLAMLLGVAAVLVSALCATAQHAVLPAGERMADVEQQVRGALDAIRAVGGLPLLLLLVAVVPGVCEELACRGLLLHAVARSLGPRVAVWTSAIVFAALHGSEYRFLPQLVLGLVLGMLTLRTGSVLPAMVVHAVHNGLAVAAMTVAEPG